VVKNENSGARLSESASSLALVFHGLNVKLSDYYLTELNEANDILWKLNSFKMLSIMPGYAEVINMH
jgi:hypothetical protein